MYCLKPLVKVDYLLKRRVFLRIVFLEQFSYFLADIFRLRRVISSDLIGEHFIVPDPEPLLALVGSA